LLQTAYVVCIFKHQLIFFFLILHKIRLLLKKQITFEVINVFHLFSRKGIGTENYWGHPC